MLFNQLEKIRSSVKVASIFTEHEREEWLSLLELMNDKQLLELEKILIQVLPKKEALPQSLHLSHIINMPQNATVVTPTKSKVPLAEPLVVARNLEEKKKNSFLTKFNTSFKKIFTTKEITTSRPENQLELPDRTEHVSTAFLKKEHLSLPSKPLLKALEPAKSTFPHPPVPVEKTVGLKEALKVPVPFSLKLPKIIPKPFVRPEAAQPNKVLLPEPSKTMKPFSQNVSKLKVPTNTNTPHKLAQFLEQQSHVENAKYFTEPVIVKAGLENTKMLLDARFSDGLAPAVKTSLKPHADLGKLVKEKPSALVESSFEKLNLVEPNEQVTNLDNVQDVSTLTISSWQKIDYKELVQAFRKIINTYGYHDIIFSLEQSPVYKSYLETGVQVLGQNISFENLNDKQNVTGKKYLNKSEFERFTDMLRQIQSG